jgi:hypothetical protein
MVTNLHLHVFSVYINNVILETFNIRVGHKKATGQIEGYDGNLEISMRNINMMMKMCHLCFLLTMKLRGCMKM